MYSTISDWCEYPGSTLSLGEKIISSFNCSGSLSASLSSPQHRAMGTHPLAGWEWGHLTVSSQWATSPRESLLKSMQWTGAWKRINKLHWHDVTSERRKRARTGLNLSVREWEILRGRSVLRHERVWGWGFGAGGKPDEGTEMDGVCLKISSQIIFLFLGWGWGWGGAWEIQVRQVSYANLQHTLSLPGCPGWNVCEDLESMLLNNSRLRPETRKTFVSTSLWQQCFVYFLPWQCASL